MSAYKESMTEHVTKPKAQGRPRWRYSVASAVSETDLVFTRYFYVGYIYASFM